MQAMKALYKGGDKKKVGVMWPQADTKEFWHLPEGKRGKQWILCQSLTLDVWPKKM